jgi:hypothetical protein
MENVSSCFHINPFFCLLFHINRLRYLFSILSNFSNCRVHWAAIAHRQSMNKRLISRCASRQILNFIWVIFVCIMRLVHRITILFVFMLRLKWYIMHFWRNRHMMKVLAILLALPFLFYYIVPTDVKLELRLMLH